MKNVQDLSRINRGFTTALVKIFFKTAPCNETRETIFSNTNHSIENFQQAQYKDIDLKKFRKPYEH